MSGGSHNYLCYTEIPDIISKTSNMEDMEDFLIKEGFDDVAKDVRNFIDFCKGTIRRTDRFLSELNEVFWGIEWYCSADIGKDTLIKTLEEYRQKKGNKND